MIGPVPNFCTKCIYRFDCKIDTEKNSSNLMSCPEFFRVPTHEGLDPNVKIDKCLCVATDPLAGKQEKVMRDSDKKIVTVWWELLFTKEFIKAYQEAHK